VIQGEELIFYVTLPFGVPFLWLVGFFIYVILHAKIIVSIILPKIQPGEYPLNSSQTRIYVLRLSADNLAKYWVKSLEWISFFAQIFLYPFMLKRYGVKMGKNVYVSTETRIDGLPLIEIGDNSFIGPRAVIGAHINHHGSNLLFKPVKIGNRCFIGFNSVVTPGAEFGDDSILGGYSVVLLDAKIPSGEVWVGLPARLLKNSKKKEDSATKEV
jgi:acetyltransferase-like isoleucine patch superfamily enzyme